jgi:prepilin signal peptidase PulO-like enzyme (type II secretory pathway)
MEIILGTILFCLGYFIAVCAYIDGFELEGKFISNIKINLFPKRRNYITTYILAGLISLVVGLFLYGTNDFDAVYKVILYAVSIIFMHAALVDLICYQIPLVPSLISIGVLVIYNIVMLIMNFINGVDCSTVVYTNNLISGFVGALMFFLIIKISKGKGMGDGDMIMFAIIGFALGLFRMILAFYVMIILGSIIGISIAIIKRKFKGVRLAFVPFMFIGFLIAMVYGARIVDWYLTLIYY